MYFHKAETQRWAESVLSVRKRIGYLPLRVTTRLQGETSLTFIIGGLETQAWRQGTKTPKPYMTARKDVHFTTVGPGCMCV